MQATVKIQLLVPLVMLTENLSLLAIAVVARLPKDVRVPAAVAAAMVCAPPENIVEPLSKMLKVRAVAPSEAVVSA